MKKIIEKIDKLIGIYNITKLGKWDIAMTRQYFEYDSFRQRKNMAILIFVSILLGLMLFGLCIGIDNFSLLVENIDIFIKDNYIYSYLIFFGGISFCSLFNLMVSFSDYDLYRLNYGKGDKK